MNPEDRDMFKNTGEQHGLSEKVRRRGGGAQVEVAMGRATVLRLIDRKGQECRQSLKDKFNSPPPWQLHFLDK